VRRAASKARASSSSITVVMVGMKSRSERCRPERFNPVSKLGTTTSSSQRTGHIGWPISPSATSPAIRHIPSRIAAA
jgi:hypothetical protein